MVAVCCCLLAGCVSGSRPVSSSAGAGLDQVGTASYPVGKRSIVPAITGKTLAGQQLSISQFAGQVVVINVWASWCDPCRAESPALAKLAKTIGSRVQFIGLDEMDTTAAAKKFLASVGADYPELLDPDGSLLGHLHLLPTKGIPSTMVIDPNNRMAGRVIGPVTAEALRRLIDSARQG